MWRQWRARGHWSRASAGKASLGLGLGLSLAEGQGRVPAFGQPALTTHILAFDLPEVLAIIKAVGGECKRKEVRISEEQQEHD